MNYPHERSVLFLAATWIVEGCERCIFSLANLLNVDCVTVRGVLRVSKPWKAFNGSHTSWIWWGTYLRECISLKSSSKFKLDIPLIHTYKCITKNASEDLLLSTLNIFFSILYILFLFFPLVCFPYYIGNNLTNIFYIMNVFRGLIFKLAAL